MLAPGICIQASQPPLWVYFHGNTTYWKAYSMDNKLFDLGRIIITDKATLVLKKHKMNGLELLDRHTVGDWGDISEGDKQANNEALKTGEQLLSAYFLPDETKVWIITDIEVDDQHHRKSTTVLLPEEY